MVINVKQESRAIYSTRAILRRIQENVLLAHASPKHRNIFGISSGTIAITVTIHNIIQPENDLLLRNYADRNSLHYLCWAMANSGLNYENAFALIGTFYRKNFIECLQG